MQEFAFLKVQNCFTRWQVFRKNAFTFSGLLVTTIGDVIDFGLASAQRDTTSKLSMTLEEHYAYASAFNKRLDAIGGAFSSFGVQRFFISLQ